MEANAYDDIYDEYIENILSISNLSNKDHYIFYDYKIKDDVCYDEVYMLNENGEKGEFGKRNFPYNEDLYEKFIKKLVKEFCKVNTINSKDVIYEEDEPIFKLITENRDIFTISGLEKDKCEELLNMINENNTVNSEIVLTQDNSGKVNYLILIFIVVLIIFIISLLILL